MRTLRADGGPATGTGPVAVELKLFATIRDAACRRSLTRTYPEPVTVRAVLADLEATVPGLSGALLHDAGELRRTVTVVRNGRNVVHLDGLDTPLADGDTLAVMPPVSGGGHRPGRGR